MQRIAKIFMNNRSQAVRLPKEFQLRAREVFIRKSGGDIVISPRPADWSAYFEEGPVASPDFMSNVDELPLQEREV
jgi:antitoxin VapB